MIKNNTVDIILPIYNPNDKVFEAIDSVLAQTYTSWHLYIVDDASNDDSLDKINDKYRKYSDKITYFQFKENKRPAACRNYAIKQGNGKFISFIDQDDVWLPNKLELQVNYIARNNVDAVHGNVQFIDNHNNVIMHDKWKAENQSRREVDWIGLSQEELGRKMFLKPNIRIISSMVSREIFEKVGWFKEQFFGGEDELFWLELALHGKIGFIDKMLILRRVHTNNTSKIFNIDRLQGYNKVLLFVKNKYGGYLKKELLIKNRSKNYALLKNSLKRKKILLAFTTLLNLLLHNPIFTVKSLFKSLSTQIGKIN